MQTTPGSPDGPVQNTGAAFDDADVARAYAHRAPYPAPLFARLARIAAGGGRALDLGCGTGKVSAGLSPYFGEIVAIDPSRPMIEAGRAANDRLNIRWIEGFAEKTPLQGPFDLAVAGAAIHWMRQAEVFPRLVGLLAPTAPVAIVEGDGPAEADWREAYEAVLIGWVERLGGRWNSPEFVAAARRHEAWIDVEGREEIAADCEMALEDLIDGEHSRATWTRAKLGPELSAAFDADLRTALMPHARDGAVSFRTSTRLLWGRPRRTPSRL